MKFTLEQQYNSIFCVYKHGQPNYDSRYFPGVAHYLLTGMDYEMG